MYSATFAHYYDQLMGDYSSITNTTIQLVREYLPTNSSLLELGCGTGNMLVALADTYKVSALDNSPEMLKIAKKKVPSVKFYHGDMATFQHKVTYDGILCIFDTINHLTSFSQWEQLFATTAKHLNASGVFIFDMNTQKRLERLAQAEPYIGKLNKTTLTKVVFRKTKEYLYSINFELFENIHQEHVTFTEETVEESTFPIDQVKKSLGKHFHIIKMVDPIRKRITKNTGRVFFVCKKK